MTRRIGEKALESKLGEIVKRRGGKYLKLTQPNHIPDRLLLLPGGFVEFVELKSFGEVPRPGQKAMHAILRGLGFNVYVIDRVEQIEEAIERWDKLNT